MDQFLRGDVVCVNGSERQMTVWCIIDSDIPMIPDVLMLPPEKGIECIWWENDDFHSRTYQPECLTLFKHREYSTFKIGDNVVLASGSNTFVILETEDEDDYQMLYLEDIKTGNRYTKEGYLFDKIKIVNE